MVYSEFVIIPIYISSNVKFVVFIRHIEFECYMVRPCSSWKPGTFLAGTRLFRTRSDYKKWCVGSENMFQLEPYPEHVMLWTPPRMASTGIPDWFLLDWPLIPACQLDQQNVINFTIFSLPFSFPHALYSHDTCTFSLHFPLYQFPKHTNVYKIVTGIWSKSK